MSTAHRHLRLVPPPASDHEARRAAALDRLHVLTAKHGDLRCLAAEDHETAAALWRDNDPERAVSRLEELLGEREGDSA
jgi:hypothetical protein